MSVSLTAKYWDIKLNSVIIVLTCSLSFHPFTQLHTNGQSGLSCMVIVAGFIKWLSCHIELITDVWKINAIALIYFSAYTMCIVCP
jgi:hypothetical protein